VTPDYAWDSSNEGEDHKLRIGSLPIPKDGVLPGEVDNALVLYENELTLTGDEATRAEFRAIRPKEQVRIRGRLSLQRGLYSSRLEAAALVAARSSAQ